MEDKRSFEECLKSLEEIVSKLENGEIALDEAVKLYKDGLDAAKRCYEIFNQTKEMVAKRVDGDTISEFKTED